MIGWLDAPGSAESLTIWQTIGRAILIYIGGVLLVRVGDRRFLGKNAAFDVIFGVILGSVLGRAIAPTISIVGALIAGVVLVGIHWAFAVAAYHLDWFGRLIKGDSHVLVEDGAIRWNAMRRHHISEKDLVCALRTNAALADAHQVRRAYLERSGDVSVIPAPVAPRVVDVQVVAGVQTVRIELG